MNLDELHKLVKSGIAKKLEEDGHCKSYEGAMRLECPNHFSPEDGYSLELDCYVLGPNRHYRWKGDTVQECIDKAEADIAAWIAGDNEIINGESFMNLACITLGPTTPALPSA